MAHFSVADYEQLGEAIMAAQREAHIDEQISDALTAAEEEARSMPSDEMPFSRQENSRKRRHSDDEPSSCKRVKTSLPFTLRETGRKLSKNSMYSRPPLGFSSRICHLVPCLRWLLVCIYHWKMQ